jgi:transcriptional regulator with XRE-family HTH domain
MIQVGKQIEKALAQKTDFDHAALSKRARISPSRLSRIIGEQAHPSMAELQRIADALAVKPSFLVEEDGEPLPVDGEVTKLLANPTLATSLWTFSQLPEVDQKMVVNLIQRFAQK